MNTLSKVTIIVLLPILILPALTFGQSIRKDYREMTDSEKQAYVDALWDLYNSGVIEDFVDDHETYMGIAHGNERFLPWHRIFLNEFEDELQNINPDLAIPYWDWRDDRSTSPEWEEQDFLGQFESELENSRTLGDVWDLPTENDVDNLLDLSDFSSGGGNYSTGNSPNAGFGGTPNSPGDLEAPIHDPPHVWVGGDMNFVPEAPRDPIFYFHHAMVDMLWQMWEDDNDASNFSSNSLDMSPYGTLDPHDYVDGRDFGVWYARDGVVELAEYATDGDETYRYTGTIQAESNYTVASGSDVEFKSGEKIILDAGFEAEQGSEFYASVGGNVGSVSSQQTEKPIAEEASTEEITDTPAAYSLSQNYPNPFNPTTQITFALPEQNHVILEVYDVTGRRVATLVDAPVEAGEHNVTFDASDLSSGIYIYRLQAGSSFMESKQMTVVK